MKRLLVVLGAATLIAAASPSAGAYGGGASHDTWQVGLSFNCNSPAYCGDEPRRLLGLGGVRPRGDRDPGRRCAPAAGIRSAAAGPGRQAPAGLKIEIT